MQVDEARLQAEINGALIRGLGERTGVQKGYYGDGWKEGIKITRLY